MTPEQQQIALIKKGLFDHIARNLPLQALVLALLDTHPNKKALFDAFQKRAKLLEEHVDRGDPDTAELMRSLSDETYHAIVAAITGSKERARRK